MCTCDNAKNTTNAIQHAQMSWPWIHGVNLSTFWRLCPDPCHLVWDEFSLWHRSCTFSAAPGLPAQHVMYSASPAQHNTVSVSAHVTVCNTGYVHECQAGNAGFRKTRVFKNPTQWVSWVSQTSVYLNEQLGSLLVDLVHQLSFYLDLSVLWII